MSKINPEKFIEAGDRVTEAAAEVELKKYEWNLNEEISVLQDRIKSLNAMKATLVG